MKKARRNSTGAGDRRRLDRARHVGMQPQRRRRVRPGAGQPGGHRQGDGDAHEAHLLDLGARHRERGEALRGEVPRDRRQGRERRPGPAALPEAAQRDRGRRGCTGCRADRVPVHPVVRAPRVPARPDAVRRGRPLGRLRRLGVEPGLARRAGLGDPAGRRPDGQPLSRGHPDAGRHHRAARHVGRVRDRGEGREGCHGLVHLEPRRHPGRPDDRLLLAGGRQAVRVQRRGHGQRSTSTATRPSRSRRTGPT